MKVLHGIRASLTESGQVFRHEGSSKDRSQEVFSRKQSEILQWVL